MKNLILLLVASICFLSCKKESVEPPVSETAEVAIATVITDPSNYPPSTSNVRPNALQLNYGSIKVAKSMNLMLTGISPDMMANYSINIYVKSGTQYLHLPGTTASGFAYNYSVKATFPYCNVTITRPAGTGEVFNDVIIVAAKNTYLLTLSPSLSFSNYSTVKARLGL